MLILSLWIIVCTAAPLVTEHYVRITNSSSSIQPHWPHIYLDGTSDYAYATPEGLASFSAAILR